MRDPVPPEQEADAARVGESWTMYAVSSEQIRKAGDDDHDHADAVWRVDGPKPDRIRHVVDRASLTASQARERELREKLNDESREVNAADAHAGEWIQRAESAEAQRDQAIDALRELVEAVRKEAADRKREADLADDQETGEYHYGWAQALEWVADQARSILSNQGSSE